MDSEEHISYKCPRCNGEPLPPLTVKNITFTNRVCEFCYGKKKLNWLEVIFGVRFDRFIDNLAEAITTSFNSKKK